MCLCMLQFVKNKICLNQKAMTGMRDELANNLAKLTSIDDRKSKVERHLAREHRKLTETDDTERDSRPNQKARECTLWHRTWKTGKARSPLHEHSNPPVPDQQNPWDIQAAPPWRHHTGWAYTYPVSWARNYYRIDSHSNRHGDLDPCACAHRWWGKCACAGSRATWQERFERVGEKTPTGPCARPGLFSWQGRCGPSRYHWLNCLLALEYIGKDCRTFVGLGHCCGDPASRGCSGLPSEMITKAPQGHPLSQRPQEPFFLLRGPSRSVVPPLTYRRCLLRRLVLRLLVNGPG